MHDATEWLRSMSLVSSDDYRPASPAYRASCSDPATEPGVRVRVSSCKGVPRTLLGKEGLIACGSSSKGDTRVDIEGTVYSIPSKQLEFVTVNATTPVGATVVVVHGTYRGCVGALQSLADTHACVSFTDGALSGRVLIRRSDCVLFEGR
jgi:hypothetical protein